jgi:LAO/AO transport system kinase
VARDPTGLLERAVTGDRVALARLLSMVERGGPTSRQVAALAYRTPPPYTVGLTGAPGAGKSTLTDQLITAARRGWPPVGRPAERAGVVGAAATAGGDSGGERRRAEAIDQVAVLAVDPTSPYTGGAILGDRVRMQRHATDEQVFIRSMATRGHLGGLALAVPDAVRVLGAAGMPLVVLETVGVGQMEVDVASAADTTVVVVTPGWGDSMQANKAGLLEVADLFVINKADRPGAKEARRDLEQMLDLATRRGSGDWRPPVVETVATTGEGIDELWGTVAEHRAYLRSTGLLERRRAERIGQELRGVLRARVLDEVHRLAAGIEFEEAVAELVAGKTDPYTAADRLLG